MPSLVLNTQPVELALPADMPLLWALRDGANLTGPKYGCGTGECGSCMVLVDGEALPACILTLAEADGRSVTTIEGLATREPGTARHPVIQALIDEQAIQCGFCTPGLVIAIVGLLGRNPRPGDDEVRTALTNICRCGVYPRLLRAVRRVTGPVVAAVRPGPDAPAVSPPVSDPARPGPLAGAAPQE